MRIRGQLSVAEFERNPSSFALTSFLEAFSLWGLAESRPGLWHSRRPLFVKFLMTLTISLTSLSGLVRFIERFNKQPFYISLINTESPPWTHLDSHPFSFDRFAFFATLCVVVVFPRLQLITE
jgi:hypothetical protein